MIKKIISDCWALETKEYNGEVIERVAQELDAIIELENGIFLKSLGDGRYYESDNDNNRYAAVLLQEYDENGEPESAELLGFAQV